MGKFGKTVVLLATLAGSMYGAKYLVDYTNGDVQRAEAKREAAAREANARAIANEIAKRGAQ